MLIDKKNLILFYLLFFLLFETFNIKNSNALSSWSQEYTKEWIIKHKYLLNTPLYGMGDYIGSEKNLKNGIYIRFDSYLYDFDAISIGIKRKKYLEYIDIWEPNNISALNIIKNIYNVQMANDFKKSINIYSSVVYNALFFSDGNFNMDVERGISSSNFKKLEDEYVSYLDIINKKDDEIIPQLIHANGFSSFYKGKLFGYEVNTDKDNIIKFKIYTLKDFNDTINVLKQNKVIYKKYRDYLIKKNGF